MMSSTLLGMEGCVDDPLDIYCRISNGDPHSGSGGVLPGGPFQIAAAGKTDTGCVRANNEDEFVLLPKKSLYMVADGMGGHQSGEVASRMAVASVGRIFQASPGLSASQRMENLKTSVELASDALFWKAQKNPDLFRMGTTIVALHLDELGGLFCAAHVGDSRIYRIRRGKIEQLTRDHSLINQLIDMGCTPEFAAQARRNIISRAVGLAEAVEADMQSGPIEAGDVFLLCSDGLTDVLYDEAILEVVLSHEEPEVACRELIQRANEGGGPDNITAVLVRANKL